MTHAQLHGMQYVEFRLGPSEHRPPEGALLNLACSQHVPQPSPGAARAARADGLLRDATA